LCPNWKIIQPGILFEAASDGALAIWLQSLQHIGAFHPTLEDDASIVPVVDEHNPHASGGEAT